MNLLPRDERFFDLFQQHVRILCQAAELFRSAVESGYDGVTRAAKQMEALERNADEITHQIFSALRSTFITPFDPEDIQALATSLDNVLDALEDVTFRISAYRVDPMPSCTAEMARMIEDSCRSLATAIADLRQRKPVLNACIEVNRLENQADAVERTAIADLFSREIDPITLLKHKEVLELLEHTTDACEDVSDVILSVAVKGS